MSTRTLYFSIGVVILLAGYSSCRSSQTTDFAVALSSKEQRILNDIASEDAEGATRAVREAFSAGEMSVDWLVRCRGDNRPYYGKPFGSPMSSTMIVYPEDSASADWPITVEVVCIYLLESMFRGDLESSSSMLLTDHRLPANRRRARNTPELIELAWSEIDDWYREYRQYGYETTKAQGHFPLTNVGFW